MKHKNRRHNMISDIIKTHEVETQEDLTRLLLDLGVSVTQATVSRDIKEMNLVKVMQKNGKYKYERRVPAAADSMLPSKTMGIFKDGIVSVASAQNLVVIKCYSGMAGAVAAALDSMHRSEVVGSVAGDDTIFVATGDSALASRLTDDLLKIIKNS